MDIAIATPTSTRLHKRTVFGVTLFMLTVLATFVAQRQISLIAGSILCATYALATLGFASFSRAQLCIFGLVCLLFFPGFAKPYHGLSPVFYFFSTISVFFAAKSIARHPSEVFFYSFRLIYGLAIVVIGWILYKFWGYKEPFGEAIPGSSTNGIPAYLIVIQIGLSLTHFLERRRLPYLSPFLTGAVAFFGNGRGSLVVAGLIITTTLLVNLYQIGSMHLLERAAYILFFAALSVLLIVYGPDLYDLISRYTKLSVGLVDTNRLEIRNQYFHKINPWTLLFGADYENTIIEYKYRGNPHISFIRTHSLFGLPLTLAALASPLLIFLSQKNLRSQIVFFSFVSMALLRAASEPIFFPTLLDFFYFLFFFLFFRYAPGNISRVVYPRESGA